LHAKPASINWSLRVEFITGISTKIFYNTSSVDAFEHSRVLPKVNVEHFECTIPLKVFAALKCHSDIKKVSEFNIQ
jgi:hypothetical protein